MTEFISVWNRNTGRKLDHRVPRTYLRVFPHLSETPATKNRRKKEPPTPTPEAETKEESHAPQSD